MNRFYKYANAAILIATHKKQQLLSLQIWKNHILLYCIWLVYLTHG